MSTISAQEDGDGHAVYLDDDLFSRWRGVGAALGLSGDSLIAAFLIQQFQIVQQVGIPSEASCVHCQRPLTLICTWCTFPPQLTPLVSASDSGTGSGDDTVAARKACQDLHRQYPPTFSQARLSCGACNDIFTTNTSLDTHERTHQSSEIPQLFEDFSVSFSTVKSNSNAQFKKHKKNDFDCNKCDASFTSILQYRNHMKSHGMTCPFVCNECSERFKTRRKLKSHTCVWKQNAGENLQESDGSCSMNVQGGTSVKDSVPKAKSQQYACEECGQVLASKLGLKKHEMRAHHKGQLGELHVCDHCGKGFSHSMQLLRHSKRHSGEKSYICDVCNSGFFDKYALTRHKKIHAADRQMFFCEVCGTSFTDRMSLKNHLRIHSGERPYKCSFCNATFRLSSILRKHERKHKGDRKFECTDCGRTFTEREYWRSHVRTHTGERPFVCEVCGAGFAQKGSLNSHKKTHTAGNKNTC